jgi:cyclic pyranopterin monophosphate synthase
MNSAAFQAFLTSSGAGGSDTWIQGRLAGILASKTADQAMLITHSINVTGIDLSYTVNETERKVTVRCEVRTKERIGAETSAMLACGTTLMVLANSLRVIDRDMTIEGLHVVRDGQES